jgi:5-methyltetrahydrofolate--homocysteine methyltransferase
MKASVAYLEQFMEKNETSVKGKILLATVKGDVHDIGKNLVEIILSNNGYSIINLGIKVPPEKMIEAYHKEKPDAIGLSGLLVKSAQQMVTTAQDLRTAGIDVPILVGGAALTRKFTKTRIQPEYEGVVVYAKDAMDGLDIANRLSDPEKRMILVEELRESMSSHVQTAGAKPQQEVAPLAWEKNILRNYPLRYLLPYINWEMLLGKHLGLRGSVEKLLAANDSKAVQLKENVDSILAEAESRNLIQAHAMYRFYPAQGDGNDIIIYDPQMPDRILERFTFPRQAVEPYLCLSDFLKPVESGIMDYVGFLIVTAGHGIRELSEQYKNAGDYLKSHAVQACALELAEAFAERVHHMMRDTWGFPDPQEMTMKQRHGARYQGIRVSFGYPACPNLEDQEPLFRLLKPEEIGIQLTEGFMMDPEASVSAMVFAHPQAQYFNVEKV